MVRVHPGPATAPVRITLQSSLRGHVVCQAFLRRGPDAFTPGPHTGRRYQSSAFKPAVTLRASERPRRAIAEAHTPRQPQPSNLRIDEPVSIWPSPAIKVGAKDLDSEESETKEAFAATELDLDGRDRSQQRPSDGHSRIFPIRQHVDHLLSIFLPSHTRRGKGDLSLVNVVDWEEKLRTLDQPADLTFRTSTPLRKILFEYLRDVGPAQSPILPDTPCMGQDDNTRLSAFSAATREILREFGFTTKAVVNWAWIFSGPSPDRAIHRYVRLVEGTNPPHRTRVPKFILLQLLRAEAISGSGLKTLIDDILKDLDSCRQKAEYRGWNWITRVCLVVRLLRHARKVAPDCLDSVCVIIRHLFADFYTVHQRPLDAPELKRLTHIFNRFLSLMALTPVTSPFNAYILQQTAQLTVVRLMIGFAPQLPLTREGYRALIAVQLLHRKTGPEKEWAHVKSLSWPPWRQIRSGIEQDLQYPGKESRVTKLLRRMSEAGYSHGSWEKNAAILAGWDTDKSPTIQTRSMLMRQRQMWRPPRPITNSLEEQSKAEPTLWASRIRATRTKREAWASFCAYQELVASSPPAWQPYFAMLDRLLARTATSSSRLALEYTPGDVKEVFEDSSNPRDLVYIPEEIPSADEFYQRMLQAGIKPAGTVLSSLINDAPTVAAGFSYIQDSSWDEVTKDVLRHAEKYPPATIQASLNKIPRHSLTAFVRLLCKNGNEAHPSLAAGRSQLDVQAGHVNKRMPTIPPAIYAWQLLESSSVTDIRVWNAYLEEVFVCLADDSRGVIPPPALRSTLWRRIHTTFTGNYGIAPDLDTLRSASKIALLCLSDPRLRAPPRWFSSIPRAIFFHAVQRQSMSSDSVSPDIAPHSAPVAVVPEVDDVLSLVGVLAAAHDVAGLMALVRWINDHAKVVEQSKTLPNDELDPDENDGALQSTSPVRHAMSAIRLLLDGEAIGNPDKAEFWPGTPLDVPLETIEEARELCQAIEWPSDEEARAFVSINTTWLERIHHAAKVSASKLSNGVGRR